MYMSFLAPSLYMHGWRAQRADLRGRSYRPTKQSALGRTQHARQRMQSASFNHILVTSGASSRQKLSSLLAFPCANLGQAVLAARSAIGSSTCTSSCSHHEIEAKIRTRRDVSVPLSQWLALFAPLVRFGTQILCRATQEMKLLTTLLPGFGLGLLSLFSPAAAHPLFADMAGELSTRDAVPGDFYLRIMPLGASITAGEFSPSPEKNGYRKFTRDQLRINGWKVNMVGNFKRGTMKDNVRQSISLLYAVI
jgi:hypothetical protein